MLMENKRLLIAFMCASYNGYSNGCPGACSPTMTQSIEYVK